MHISSRSMTFTAYALILGMLWPGVFMGVLVLTG